MPKIYLSYAEEDSERCQKIKEYLIKDLGWEISDWQDPSQRSYQWINKIEKDISEASAFLALVSPNYLSSPWCNYERNMALRREIEFQKLGRQFIFLAQILPTNKMGFLANYDWIDLTSFDWESKIRNLIERFKRDSNNTLPTSSHYYSFQDRLSELNELKMGLTNIEGRHFWQIISAPEMGKTRMLQKLIIDLSNKDPNWHITQIDLRDQPLNTRLDLKVLLSLLFNRTIQGAINSSQLQTIARQIIDKNTPWMCILDSAELLSDLTARDMRECISNIYSLLMESGRRSTWLVFIVASRRSIPGLRGVVPKPAFATLTLSHFTVNIIEPFLRKMASEDNVQKDDQWFKSKSHQLFKASEGLPGLLIIYMEWIRNNGYIIEPSIDSQFLFISLAKPYVDNYMLTPTSLLPSISDSDLLKPRRTLLERTILGLSVFRCFTERYYHQYLKEETRLIDELKRAKWTREQLWGALRRTYLIEPTYDIWVRLYPSVRRLLFRYQNISRKEQIQAHQKAVQFYSINGLNLHGTDEAITLIEHLWHQVEYHRLTDSRSDHLTLLEYAKQLLENGIKSNHHIDRDLAFLIEERLHNDTELQESLAEIHKDLFYDIIEIINQYIS